MGKHLPVQLICPGALRVYSQIRIEKHRSVRKSMPRRLRPRSTQLEQEVLIQAHDSTMFAPLSQHSNMKNMEPIGYISTPTNQVDTATRKISIPIFRPLIDIPVTTMLVYECSSPNDYRMGTTGCKILTSQPNRQGYRYNDSCKSVYHILSPGNSENYCTPVSRPSYEKCGTRAAVHRTNQAM